MKSFENETITDYESCEYIRCTYYEHDTGYKEFGCALLGDPHENECYDEYCPLNSKVEVKLD